MGAWLLGVVRLLSFRHPQGEPRWGPYPRVEQRAWGAGVEDVGYGEQHPPLPRGQYLLAIHPEVLPHIPWHREHRLCPPQPLSGHPPLAPGAPHR